MPPMHRRPRSLPGCRSKNSVVEPPVDLDIALPFGFDRAQKEAMRLALIVNRGDESFSVLSLNGKEGPRAEDALAIFLLPTEASLPRRTIRRAACILFAGRC
jgi:hypothetical protein